MIGQEIQENALLKKPLLYQKNINGRIKFVAEYRKLWVERWIALEHKLLGDVSERYRKSGKKYNTYLYQSEAWRKSVIASCWYW